MRTIVIGDVHGCLDELMDLLWKVNYQLTDRVILDGDLVDRGPRSSDVVSTAQKLNFEVIMGNHDEKHVRYRKYLEIQKKDPDFKIPMKMWGTKLETHHTLTDENIQFLIQAKPFIRLHSNFIAVHGGFQNAYPELQELKNICRIRYLDKDTHKSVPLGENFSAPPNSYFWADAWRGPECVVYGHTVHSLDNRPYFTALNGEIKTIGIDTGACFGGHLTAFVLEEDGTWWYKSVKSKVNIKPDIWDK